MYRLEMLSLHKKMTDSLESKNTKLKTEKTNQKPGLLGNKMKLIPIYKFLNHPTLIYNSIT